MVARCGAGVAYPSEKPKIIPALNGVCVAQSLVFVPFFFWPIVLSVLRFTPSDYPFGIFKLFFLAFL
jgi:hypothetical protein